MGAVVLRGDARSLPLPDGCVDLIVTSPPYFGLRSYTDGGAHYSGQIGSEATPAAYVDALVECMREWVRVLKPSGSMFINLGDKYSTGNSGQSGLAELGQRWAGGGHSDGKAKRRQLPVKGMPPKSLLGLPWRYALAVTDRLGLILRAEIIWAKPNGLPESVTDRVRRAHEQVFHFTRQPRYYSAVDEIREPQTGPEFKGRAGINSSGWQPDTQAWRSGGKGFVMRDREYNPLGKLPGSVWPIPSQPLIVPPALGVDHFAAFPMELPRRLILGWSPPGVCVACGEGRRPVTASERVPLRRADVPGRAGLNGDGAHGFDRRAGTHMSSLNTVTGYACACPDATAPTRPALVVDPFGGTGTTALVASVLGRIGISVDMSADYCRLAAWRCNDPRERAAALQVPKPPAVPDDQLAMFGEAR